MTGRWRFIVPAAVVVLLIARVVLAVGYPPGSLSDDEVNYVRMAEQLLDTGVLGFRSTEPDAFVTPGYPLFLAGAIGVGRALGMSEPLGLVRLVQALMCLLVLAPLYAASKHVAGPKAAAFAVVAAALYPSLFRAQNRILTESLFVLIFTTWIWLWVLVRERGELRLHAASAAVFALGILVRPAILPVLPLVYALELLERRQWRRVVPGALAALLTFALVMSPWWIRNRVVLGETVLFATQSGNPLLRGSDPWDPYDHEGPSVIEGVPDELQTEVAVERIRRGFATDTLNWLSWYTVGKFWWLWGRPWIESSWFSLAEHRLLVLGLGWAGVIAGMWDRRVRWLALTVVLVTALHMVFIPIPRYMFPITIAMFVLGAALLGRLPSMREPAAAV